ncbi:MAG: GHKL domain-containing protein [Prevotella sp.]|nr:GHKL domain-containing protein [Prevotella sp.]
MGLNVLDYAQKDPIKNVKAKVYIRSITLLGDSVLWGGYGQQPEQLAELSSDERHITIHYSVDYPSMLLIPQYRYRLNGGRWTSWETDSFEEFNNMPHGDYTFEVQSLDAYGRLSNIASISFSIARPIYQRWYMILLYAILLGGIVYLVVQYRLRQLEREKHRLENLVKERTAEVVKLEKVATVAKLTQGLIDRILNPLNYINNFAKLSQGLVKDIEANVEDEKDNMDPENYEDTMDVLDMLEGNLQKVGEHGANTSRTLKAMEEILKDRSGGMVKMDLNALLRQDQEMLEKYFEKEIAKYHISIKFNVPESPLIINGNAEQLSKTIMSLLGNAVYAVIKKCEKGGTSPEIALTQTTVGRMAEIHIHDNGTGISENILHKIFDPFFTTKTTGEASGVGLYLSKEIAQHHGGDITVQSEKGVYTEFTITIPTL